MRLFSLYIHWPFCLSKCPYCDFNSHVRQNIDHKPWQEAILKEMTFMATLTPNHQVQSIFFGGGTPSLIPPESINVIIEHASNLWPFADDVEVTLEANPLSSDNKSWEAFAKAGINRLSLGVQSLRPDSLKFLGRNHSVDEARSAIITSQNLFFRASFDLIYALPGQTVSQWSEELEEILSEFRPQHLSVYQLTYEPGTPFYLRWKKGEFAYPDENVAVDLDHETERLARLMGLNRYEISNYAVSGEECRHNLMYWRSCPYVGIGPGAHGRIQREQGQTYALRTHRDPDTWLQSVEAYGHGLKVQEPLQPLQRFTEILMMGLRLTEGLSLDVFQRETGRDFWDWISRENFSRYDQWISLCAGYLKVSIQGRLCLNSIITQLLASVQEVKADLCNFS